MYDPARNGDEATPPDHAPAGVPDPHLYPVMFARGSAENTVQAMQTAQDERAVRDAWRQVVAEHGIRAEEVTAVAAMWQPSVADLQFIEDTFGDVEQFYTVGRPDPGEWAAAFEAAHDLLAATGEALAQQETQQGLQRGADELLGATIDAPTLPVLRSASLPDSDDIRQRMLHWWVVPDKIYATLAQVTTMPNGQVGQLNLLGNRFADFDDFAEQAADAVAAVADGLAAEVGVNDDTGDVDVVIMTRSPRVLTSSAVCLPNLHHWLTEGTGWSGPLTVAITCPDQMHVAPAGSAEAERLRASVERAEVGDQQLRPTLLRLTEERIELLLESAR